MKHPITSFHLDDLGDWVAELACGHGQHVRHDPPWQNRPWVVMPEGRDAFIGTPLECLECDEREPPDQATVGLIGLFPDDPGDPVGDRGTTC